MAGRIRGAWRRTRTLRWLTVLVFSLLLAWAWFANGYVETPTTACTEPIDAPAHVRDLVVSKQPGYQRAEINGYLALPARHIIDQSDEAHRLMASGPPSAFPYVRSMAQYWRYAYRVFKIAQAKYGVAFHDHALFAAAGVGMSIDYTLRGAYENTLGRIVEWLATTDTPEDRFAVKTAADYAQLVHRAPFYAFDYGSRLWSLWKEMPPDAPHPARRWERKIMLSVEYGAKAACDWVMRKIADPSPSLSAGPSSSPNSNGDDTLIAWVRRLRPDIVLVDPRIERVMQPTYDSDLIAIPRHDQFRDVMTTLISQGVRFVEVAGNNDIVITATAPANWKGLRGWNVFLSEPMLAQPDRIRIAIAAPVRCLDMLLPALAASGATLERFDDY